MKKIGDDAWPPNFDILRELILNAYVFNVAREFADVPLAFNMTIHTISLK